MVFSLFFGLFWMNIDSSGGFWSVNRAGGGGGGSTAASGETTTGLGATTDGLFFLLLLVGTKESSCAPTFLLVLSFFPLCQLLIDFNIAVLLGPVYLLLLLDSWKGAGIQLASVSQNSVSQIYLWLLWDLGK